MSCRRILVTPGEPAGIGPELVVRASQQYQAYELVAVCDPSLLERAARALALPLTVREITANSAPNPCPPGEIACLPEILIEDSIAGRLNTANAAYVLKCLKRANDWCMSKHASAVVTGPVQKSVINDAGIPFSGHTEFFAEQSGSPKVVMMLATKKLRVSLATTHLALRDVADAINGDELERVITILYRELQTKFGLADPRIVVAGLNPHAGEGGHLGREEITIITPVLEKLRSQGMALTGPLPADTLFTPRHLEHCDAVLAMYHDQGLPVLKYAGFGEAVNITLGLPYIRTSVDHGTALDLAGKGTADPGSLIAALEQAEAMSLNT